MTMMCEVGISIEQKLIELDSVIIKVEGDGHCLINAVSHVLKSQGHNEVSPSKVVHQLQQELLANRTDYIQFLSSDDGINASDKFETQLENYLTYRKYNSDCVDMCVVALCNALNVNITIFDSTANSLREIHSTPWRAASNSNSSGLFREELNSASKLTVYLMRSGTSGMEHYDAIVPKSYNKSSNLVSTSKPAGTKRFHQSTVADLFAKQSCKDRMKCASVGNNQMALNSEVIFSASQTLQTTQMQDSGEEGPKSENYPVLLPNLESNSKAPLISAQSEFQPMINFPKRQLGGQHRSFRADWYKRFTWIEYNISSDSILCHYCRSVGNETHPSALPLKQDSAFCQHGFRNWKNAIEVLTNHEKSAYHLQCVYRVTSREQGVNILSALNTEHNRQRVQNTECLKIIITSVQFLARQGLSLRGKEHMDGNLGQLLSLRSQDIPSLSEWLRKKTTWTQWSVQNELLQMMSHDILRRNLAEIPKFFSIIVDETMDMNRKEQLVVLVRSVNSDLDVTENLLGLYNMDKCNAETISSAIKDVLLRCQLPISNLRGQAYDGASVMSGCKHGVGKRLQDIEPRAVMIHCQAHSLNLAVQDACARVPTLNNFMNNVNELINFIRSSPKRIVELQQLAGVFGIDVSLRPLCPTRWTLRYTSLQSLKDLLVPLRDELRSLADDRTSDRDVRAKSEGFLSILNHFEFCLLLVISLEIFEKTDRLSKTLQNSSISACEGKLAAASVIRNFQKLRCDEHFHQLWLGAMQLSIALAAEPPSVPRKRTVPRKIDESCNTAYNFSTPEQYYRVQYMTILDEAVGAIGSRFESKGYEILLVAERTLLRSFKGEAYLQEDLESLRNHFQEDLDIKRLPAQLQVLSNLPNASTVDNLKSASNMLLSLGKGEQNLIPDVFRLITLCLTLPASTASAERSFSTLRRIKSYLRSTMNQERLNHLIILHSYKEQVDSLDINKLLCEFIDRNEMRLRTFAKP